MKVLALFAATYFITLASAAVVPKCTQPSQDSKFCKELKDSYVGECTELVCKGLEIAIERNKFPERRDEATAGVTTESYEECWRVITCQLNTKTNKCEPVSQPGSATWKKADKIVEDTSKKCPAVAGATDVEVVVVEEQVLPIP